MHLATFLQDLAVIMIVAGIVTVIFHQLKQPVVLGYILSGVILSRHTPPYALIQDENTIKTLAELGVVFLMFSLGLEFSIRKLMRVGTAALIAAVAEIIVMIFIGYEIGRFFGWRFMDSIFLGAMLAISSTTIIIKALDELGMKRERFAQLIFGILIIEDILAIGILAILSSIAISGSIDVVNFTITMGKLFVFLVVSLVIGIFLVPRLLTYVTRFNSKEMMLVTVLGLCFGFSLLVIRLGYNVALGAFLIGAMMAEFQDIKLIEKLTEPLTNMFSAIFFVAIGLLVDPKVLYHNITSIIVITIALVIGKVFVCSLGVFVSGKNARTSMRVGMGLAQIGEFSFIIASLGVSLKVMSAYLYPIIVAVSAITTFLTPYLIKCADPFTRFLARVLPKQFKRTVSSYTTWIQNISPKHAYAPLKHAIQSGILSIFINLMFVIALFILESYLAQHSRLQTLLFKQLSVDHAILLGIFLVISLPFIIAIYIELKELSLIMNEYLITTNDEKFHIKFLQFMINIIPAAGVVSILVIIASLTKSILPPLILLLLVSMIVIVIAVLLWPWFIRLHSRLQIIFMNTFNKQD